MQDWAELLKEEKDAARLLPPLTPPYNGNYREERSVSERAYAGLVCVKHPPHLGIRRKQDGKCFECVAEKRRVYNARPEIRAKRNEKRRRARNAGMDSRTEYDSLMRAYIRKAEEFAIKAGRLENGAWMEFCECMDAIEYFKNGMKK